MTVSRIRLAAALVALIASPLAALPATAAELHPSVVLEDAWVFQNPVPMGAVKVNQIHKGDVVKVGACTASGLFCFVDVPGPNGWVVVSVLQTPLAPHRCQSAANCS